MDNLSALSMNIKRGGTGDPTDGDRKRCKTTQQSSTVVAVFLPEHVVSQILIRLPVKTLLRFKSVCRSWRSLISDPLFVKMHLQFSTENQDSARRIIMCSPRNQITLKLCSLPSVFDEKSLISHDLDNPFKDQERWCRNLRIVGSVNGLVCLVVNEFDYIFLWNPSTRKLRKLPQMDKKILCIYGFGYDEANSDYKVVATSSSNDVHFKTELRVYGLKSDSWRKIEDFPEKDVSSVNIFVSGSLHWPAVSSKERQSEFTHMWNIGSFNLTKETYSEIARPFHGEEDINFSKLADINGCLSLLCNGGDHKLDVWVMKEYGKVESWCKLFSVSPLISFYISIKFYHSILNVYKSEILLLGKSLVLYNMDNNMSIYLRNENYFNIVPYIESLVWPYPE